MATLRVESLLKSRPIPVRWQGWETTTHWLYRAGWDIATSEDFSRNMLRFIFCNRELKLGAYVDSYRLQAEREQWLDPGFRSAVPPIHINHISALGQVNIHLRGSPLEFNWVDASPELVETQVTTMEDLSLFKLQRMDTPSVYVDQADMSVVDHLQGILDSQAGKQKELRERARTQKEEKDKTTVVQQIVKVGY